MSYGVEKNRYLFYRSPPLHDASVVCFFVITVMYSLCKIIQISFVLRSSSKSIDRDTPTSSINSRPHWFEREHAEHRLTGSPFDRCASRVLAATDIQPFWIITWIDLMTSNSVRFDSHFNNVTDKNSACFHTYLALPFCWYRSTPVLIFPILIFANEYHLSHSIYVWCS